MLGNTEAPQRGFRLSLLGSLGPTQAKYLAIEGLPVPYADGANVGVHTMGLARPTEAAVKALHVQKYWGAEWGAPRATGATGRPMVLAN